MIRLFIALKIPFNIKEEIVKLRKEFLSGLEIYKWEPTEKIHLTLKFIGDVKEELQNEIIKRILFIGEYRRIECGLSNFGFFYRHGRPTILFIKMNVEERVKQIIDRLNQELMVLDILPEKKEFTAHLTLLRLRGREDIDILKKISEIELKHKFTADQIALYKSELMPQGSKYTELLNLKLS
jgi:2'-5' RNA ligase